MRNIVILLFVLFSVSAFSQIKPNDNNNQKLEISGNTLSIEGANSVILPASTVFNRATLLDYGAIPNDGLTDHAALQAAIADHVAGNLHYLQITDGQFDFSQSTSLNGVDGLVIEGVGDESVLSGLDDLGIFDTREVDNLVKNLVVKRIKLQNPHVDASSNHLVNSGLMFFGAGVLENCLVDDVTFTGSGTDLNGFKTGNESTDGSRYTKGVTIQNSRFNNMGRMAVELWASSLTGDDVLTDIKLLNNTVDGVGVFGNFGIAFSMAAKGKNILVQGNVFRNIPSVAMENVGPSYVTYRDNFLDSDTGRGFGMSASVKMTDIIIDGYREKAGRVTATGNQHSYFQNVDDVKLINYNSHSTISIGNGVDGTTVNNFQIIDSNIDTDDGFGIVKIDGVTDRVLIRDTNLESQSAGNPAFVLQNNNQTNLLMIGGSLRRVSNGLNLNAGGGTSEMLFSKVDDYISGVSQGYLDNYLTVSSGFDFAADNTFTGINTFQNQLVQRGGTFALRLDGGNAQGPKMEFGQVTDFDQYGAWGIYNSRMNVQAKDRDLKLFADAGGSITIDKQNVRVGVNTDAPNYPMEVNGDLNVIGDIYDDGVLLNLSNDATPTEVTTETFTLPDAGGVFAFSHVNGCLISAAANPIDGASWTIRQDVLDAHVGTDFLVGKFSNDTDYVTTSNTNPLFIMEYWGPPYDSLRYDGGESYAYSTCTADPNEQHTTASASTDDNCNETDGIGDWDDSAGVTIASIPDGSNFAIEITAGDGVSDRGQWNFTANDGDTFDYIIEADRDAGVTGTLKAWSGFVSSPTTNLTETKAIYTGTITASGTGNKIIRAYTENVAGGKIRVYRMSFIKTN